MEILNLTYILLSYFDNYFILRLSFFLSVLYSVKGHGRPAAGKANLMESKKQRRERSEADNSKAVATFHLGIAAGSRESFEDCTQIKRKMPFRVVTRHQTVWFHNVNENAQL